MKPNKSQLAEVPPAQQKRKARIQPHTALGVAVSCLAAGAFVAYAATGGHFSFAKSSSLNSPVPMKSYNASNKAKNADKSVEASGGKAQLLGQTAGATKSGFKLTQASSGGSGLIKANSIVSDGVSGFNLSESDLTPNTASDERDAVISPNGEYVAFRSNGIDLNGDRRLDATGTSTGGRYHIWIGRFQQTGSTPYLEVYQVTGTTTASLSAYNQYRPTWIPTSNEVAFVSDSATGTQIYKLALNLSSGIPNPVTAPVRLTTSVAEKQAPAWSPDGSEIAFAMNVNNNFDIYKVAPTGGTVTRVTGNGNDAAGAAAGVNDLNPTYSQLQQNVIYFSSNRTSGQGRRIWAIRNNGANATKVTDAIKRQNGSNADDDDFPTVSESGAGQYGSESLAFQSNSLIDSSDLTRDRNIWSMPVSSVDIGRDSTSTDKLFYISSFGTVPDTDDQLVYVVPPTGPANPAQKFTLEAGDINLPNPEGVAFYRGYDNDYVFTSSRGRNSVERFDAATGINRPSTYSASTTSGQFTPTDPAGTTVPTGVQVPAPAGLAVTYTTYRRPGVPFDTTERSLLVVSGSDTKTAVYRYDAETGDPLPGSGLGGARFTFGEPVITGSDPLGPVDSPAVSEGIAVNSDRTRMYVSNYALDRINVYTLVNFTDTSVQPNVSYKAGQWIGEINTAGNTVTDPDTADSDPATVDPVANLDGPTGLAFGPDLNGDGKDDLYVSSSNTNDVFAFNINYTTASFNGNVRVDKPTNGLAAPVDPVNNLNTFTYAVHDKSDSSITNLSAPEGIRIDTAGNLYVSSYGGDTINRYAKSGNTYTSNGINNAATKAAWIQFGNGNDLIAGPSYFDFNTNFANSYIPSPFVTGTTSLLESTYPYYGSASVISNILSSPTNFAASDLSGSGNKLSEDKSADIEPAYGRGNASNTPLQSLVKVVFSSNRKYSPNPTSNITGVQVNPSGGDDSATGTGAYSGTADLWITVASDVEAPIIEPQINNYPMLSPVHNPGSFAGNPDIGGRTPRSGLYPQGMVKLALNIREQGSGVSQVSFAFYDAESPSRFVDPYPVAANGDPTGPPINDAFKGTTRDESMYAWQPVAGYGFDDAGMSINATDTTSGTLTDDGPNGAVRERQANAVAGDGIYYAAKQIRAPLKAGDYYIAVRVSDRSGYNESTYQFIWGFSTKDFQAGDARDLFVSDNTAGQYIYISSRGSTFGYAVLRDPVESYYLDNWSATPITGAYSGSVIENKIITARSNPTTFENVDTWRVLSRGPIDDDILRNNYYPGTVTQIDPKDVAGGFKNKTKIITDAQRAVLWAAPYSGSRDLQFDVPGSIKEGATKEQLKGLLNAGGRLFLTGRNVLTALGEGAGGNTFRDQELYAAPDGKVRLGGATAIDPLSTNNAFPELDRNFIPYPKRTAYSDLRFARTSLAPFTAPDYRDGSYSQDRTAPAGPVDEAVFAADTIKPGDGGTAATIFESYRTADSTNDGKRIGQNIIKARGTGSNGLESRVALFSFNLDAVNRRFAKINNATIALDVRNDIALGIRTWFKTGGIHGSVIDDAGNPVANLLLGVIEIGGTQNLYAVRSDANGQYDIQGLPAGKQYRVYPIIAGQNLIGTKDRINGDDLPADDTNRAYYRGDYTIAYYIEPGEIDTPEPVKVYRSGSGSVVGSIVAYEGTDSAENPLDRTLHSAVSDMQVLLKAAPTTPAGTGSTYARVTKTNAEGAFAFSDAPSNVKLQLIINPIVDDIPVGSDIDATDLNASRIAEFARRVVGLGDPGDGKRRQGQIIAAANDAFVVNDTYINQPNNFDIDTYPTPPTDTAADEGLPLVITRGETISGKFNFVAGSNSPITAAGWVVELRSSSALPSAAPVKTTLTKADGSFAFSEVLGGSYVILGKVPASVVNGYDQLTAQTATFDTTAISEAAKSAQNITAKISHIVGAVKVNGTYVSGATVTLQKLDGTPVVYGTFPRAGTTGNVSGSANYFIGYVPNGTYKLVAQLPNGGSSLVVNPVVINSSTPVKVVDFNFTASVIKINVATAYPAISKAGATVQPYIGSTPTGSSAITDANGDVTFRGLVNGNYTFKATNTVLGVPATATSGTIAITSGNLPTVNLTLKWDSIGGTVKFNNAAKSGANIQFFLGGNEVTALATTTDGSGKYEAGKNSGSAIARPLAAGTYTVRASFALNGYTLSKEQTKVIGPNILGQIITLPDFNFQESYLTGVVKFNGSPTSGFQVQLLKADGITPYTDTDGLGRTATTDANGVYRMNSVPIGATGYKIKATKVIGAITASGVINGPTIIDGATQASPIEINISGGISGQVRVNGEGASAAKVEVLDKKKKSLSPAVVVTTDANGKYFIIGLPVTTASVSYVLQASYTENGNVLKPLTKSFKVKNGVYSPAAITFDFKVTRLKGLVRANGSPAVGATVTLLDKKGAALKVPITGTTDANGNYLLSGVKSGTYRVQASYVGATDYKEVKVGNLKTTVAPTIDLSPQELQVTTEFRVGSNTAKIGDAPGATVEILSTAGNSMGAGFTKVTDANSKTSFLGLATGSYKARITLQGYSTTTTFSVTTGLSSRVLPIILSQAKDLLLISESDKLRTTELGGIDIIRVSLLTKPTQNVQVNLVANVPTEARFSTGNSVSLTFTTTNWNVEQLVTLVGQQDNVTDGNKAFTIAGSVVTGDVLYSQIPNFTLSGINFENATIPATGPTFAANTKTLVSTPFGNVAGKITVAETFGTTGFTLYRFNAAGQKRLNAFLGITPGADWIAMSGSDNLERGRGYLLVTGAAPVTMLVPANPTIFAGDSFAVDVERNPNFEAQTGDNNINNGYDLVGFPFDPSTVAGYDILQQAQVLADGVLYPSFLEAVGAGKISNRIYTVDSQGRPVELSPANSTGRPYRGYFVKISTNKVKIILRATPSNSAGSSGSGPSGSASAVKTSIKAS